MIKTVYKKHQEGLRYLFFGGITTVINLSMYGLLVRLAGFPITISNVLAGITAVAFAFVTNKIWVFKSRSWHLPVVLREGGMFFGARIISAVVEIAGVPALYYLGLDYPLFNIEGFAAKLIVTVFVIIANYFFSKKIIFRRKSV